jgi:hypothetical protein
MFFECASPSSIRNKAMHEHEIIQFDDVAQILQQANLRRSADLGLWLTQYFQDSRLIKAWPATLHALDRMVSVIAPTSRRAN